MPEPAKLNDGVTMEQVNEALAQPGPHGPLPLVTLLGSTGNSVDGQVIYDLAPGGYVAVLSGRRPASVHGDFSRRAERSDTPVAGRQRGVGGLQLCHARHDLSRPACLAD